jgi:hypothetical protein
MISVFVSGFVIAKIPAINIIVKGDFYLTPTAFGSHPSPKGEGIDSFFITPKSNPARQPIYLTPSVLLNVSIYEIFYLTPSAIRQPPLSLGRGD